MRNCCCNKVVESAWIPQPEIIADGSSLSSALAVYKGGTYWLPRRIKFNRISVPIGGLAALATADGIIALYQRADGKIANSLPLVTSGTFTATEPPAAQNPVVSLAVPAIIVPGLLLVMWGRTTGVAWNMTAYNQGAGAIKLLSTEVPTGTHPTAFTTAIATSAVPTSINPLAGGSDVTESSSAQSAVFRVWTA